MHPAQLQHGPVGVQQVNLLLRPHGPEAAPAPQVAPPARAAEGGGACSSIPKRSNERWLQELPGKLKSGTAAAEHLRSLGAPEVVQDRSPLAGFPGRSTSWQCSRWWPASPRTRGWLTKRAPNGGGRGHIQLTGSGGRQASRKRILVTMSSWSRRRTPNLIRARRGAFSVSPCGS